MSTIRFCPIALAIVAAAACNPSTPATYKVRPSVEQLQVTHADAGEQLEVVDSKGNTVQTGTTDGLGSLMFRKVPAGDGYTVRVAGSAPPIQSDRLTVMSVDSSKPDPSTYGAQVLYAGFNYLTMRDGTTLSAFVTLPGPETGSWPTVVNYSGYDASHPGTPDPGYAVFCGDFPILCSPPSDSSALVAGLFGYATVSVNMRGTGCSGGAYDYFETMQVLDSYDVIEIVAAQHWVRHNSVGMVGLSYPGISQLFVGSAQPPHLAAIAPMSVIGNTASTLLPGGMLNDGFALAWVDAVLSKAVPYGQGWEQGRVDAGDTQCAENQLLHGQLVDNVAEARATTFYDPAVHDPLNPTTFVNKITVPIFMTGGWQDEQTGPFFFTLMDKFTSSPAWHVTTFNGVHIDGFAPDVLAEWQAFLELFVAKRVPIDPAAVRNISSFLFQGVFAAPLVLPSTRWYAFTDYDAAVAAWKAEPPIREIFERGAGDTDYPGAPVGTFEQRFAKWPPDETAAQRLYFHADGGLDSTMPGEPDASAQFRLDPDAGERGILAPGGNVWDDLPAYDWQKSAPGDAVIVESAPLAADTMLYGTASVDLWISSPVDDADLQVTLSEIRGDGKEIYVQSGWLRASFRKPGPDATDLWPAQTFEQQDWSLLTPGEWTLARIGTAGIGHVLRQGSKLRITVNTPGGSRAEWRFALKTFPSDVHYSIGLDANHPSSINLPVISGVTIPPAAPLCNVMRGQPCR